MGICHCSRIPLEMCVTLSIFLTVWLADKRLTIIVYCIANLGIAVCVFFPAPCYKASRMTNYRSARMMMMKNGVNLCL